MTTEQSPLEIDLGHKYLLFRRTKIVATIGPATQSPRMLRQLIKAGLDVARINFSHGDPAAHVATMRLIRETARRCGKTVAILADLCGPKIRVGEMRGGGVELKTGASVTITVKSVLGTESLIPSQYRRLVVEAKVGETILLDDGNLELTVTKKSADVLTARVVRGGLLKSHKGMNLPETRLKVPALTAKDKRDVRFCIQGEADYIALSFVRTARDVRGLKRFLAAQGATIPIVSKIEKPEALHNIQEIVDESDAIMIARGDLGVEMPARKVPLIQNRLIQIVNAANKPVIVATQMLESMIDRGRPTRAEVSDVAGACLAGADAVMLSAETAAGKYPLEAFSMMDSILRETEAYQFFALGGRFQKAAEDWENDVQEALGVATAQISRDLKVHCIFVLTRTGYTARIVSADRPAALIVGLAPSEAVMRRLKLYWGVHPYRFDQPFSQEQYIRFGERLVAKVGLAKPGDFVIMMSGLGGKSIATNTIVVHQLQR
jgi:pyruvate kinase